MYNAGIARVGGRMIRTGGFLALVCMACLLVAGCTDVARGTGDTIKLVWRGTPRLSPTAEQVAAKPYYQLRATTAHGDAILILGNVDGKREYWYGANGVALVLENGRIVQTIGLPENLERSVANGS
ncbi:YjbF family lipoprotein, partial [Dyella sp.]|uniref:YjbF family lipoprotein n=1 Tax=Dyella sp. TaxID=1869338 RepID=UPI002D7662F2